MQDGQVVREGDAVRMQPEPGEERGRILLIKSLYEQRSDAGRPIKRADAVQYEWPQVRYAAHAVPRMP